MARISREAATDNLKVVAAADGEAAVCRPLSGALGWCDTRFLGLTPQAMSLSRLWRLIADPICRSLRPRRLHHKTDLAQAFRVHAPAFME
jgi:hypothetical protein